MGNPNDRNSIPFTSLQDVQNQINSSVAISSKTRLPPKVVRQSTNSQALTGNYSQTLSETHQSIKDLKLSNADIQQNQY